MSEQIQTGAVPGQPNERPGQKEPLQAPSRVNPATPGIPGTPGTPTERPVPSFDPGEIIADNKNKPETEVEKSKKRLGQQEKTDERPGHLH